MECEIEDKRDLEFAGLFVEEIVVYLRIITYIQLQGINIFFFYLFNWLINFLFISYIRTKLSIWTIWKTF